MKARPSNPCGDFELFAGTQDKNGGYRIISIQTLDPCTKEIATKTAKEELESKGFSVNFIIWAHGFFTDAQRLRLCRDLKLFTKALDNRASYEILYFDVEWDMAAYPNHSLPINRNIV